jgi:hypothetical protein
MAFDWIGGDAGDYIELVRHFPQRRRRYRLCLDAIAKLRVPRRLPHCR